jgi:YD repeat-containing protein
MVYVRSMHPTQPLAEYEYDSAGDLVKAFDALRNETDFDYDARHRLVTMTEPAPAAGQSSPVTSYLYDAVGQLLIETDPLGRQTGYRYNQLGQVRRLLRAAPDGPNAGLIFDPSTGQAIGPITEFMYDATGNLP